MVFRVFFRVKMALPGGYSNDRKKNSAGLNVFMKQRENRAARKKLAPLFFRP